MKTHQLRMILLFCSFLVLSSCNKAKDALEALSQTLSIGNLEGTWNVTEATSLIWQENVGVISQETNNEILGAVLVFSGSTVSITTPTENFTYPYTINVLTNTLAFEVDNNKFDTYDVITFSLPNMVVLNKDPQAEDYEFSNTHNANIYKQNRIILVKD